jgi:uncharacterized membrane protein
METIQFPCPKCSQQLLIPMEQAGQPCRCTTCESVVTSPPNYLPTMRNRVKMALRNQSIHTEEVDGLGDAVQGIWRDGSLLVVTPHATLPPRCLYSNERSDNKYSGQIAWHEPWVYILLVAGVIVYFIASLFMTKRMNVTYYLSERQLAKRAVGWIIISVLSAIGLAAAIILPWEYFFRFEFFVATFLGCSAVCIVFLIVSAFYACPVRVKRIEGQYAWISGVHFDYLAALPVFPTYENTYSELTE